MTICFVYMHGLQQIDLNILTVTIITICFVYVHDLTDQQRQHKFSYEFAIKYFSSDLCEITAFYIRTFHYSFLI